ncbi:MAG: hypothetical protein ACXVDN_11545 [Ktedonobacteraceae bacterium]
MEGRLRLQTRRAILQQIIPQYREASTVKQKSKLLDTFTIMTGYNRKYAMWLLNHVQEGQPHLGAHARALWSRSPTRAFPGMPPTASAPTASCPFSPRLSKRFTRHGYHHLDFECRRQLLSMSAATADRLLRFQRKLA